MVAAKTPAAVLGFQSQPQVDIEVHAARHDVPGPLPATDGASADVARPDRNVMGFHRGNQIGDVFWPMAEVGIQVQQVAIFVIDAVLKCIDSGCSQTLVRRPQQKVQPAVIAASLLDKVSRAVRTIVVNDQNVGIRRKLAQFGNQRTDILGFVECADRDEKFEGHRQSKNVKVSEENRSGTITH